MRQRFVVVLKLKVAFQNIGIVIKLTGVLIEETT